MSTTELFDSFLQLSISDRSLFLIKIENYKKQIFVEDMIKKSDIYNQVKNLKIGEENLFSEDFLKSKFKK